MAKHRVSEKKFGFSMHYGEGHTPVILGEEGGVQILAVTVLTSLDEADIRDLGLIPQSEIRNPK
ncbi:MAG: hypothetical protein KAV83_08200 [Desulfobacterales bacterium]|nr:hypothetical protein [Desulfobacterales bacterium]